MLQPVPPQLRDPLKSFYRRFAPQLADPIWDQIAPLHLYRKVIKGEVLVQEGEVCQWFGLVIRGTFRFYTQVENQAVVGEFFLPGNLLSSLASYITGTPSRIVVDALTDGELYVITKENEKQIASLFPDYYKVTKLTRDKVYSQAYNRYVMHLVDTAENRYLNLQQYRPELLQNAPQYMIASYLGVTPEALSRIRKNLSRKK